MFTFMKSANAWSAGFLFEHGALLVRSTVSVRRVHLVLFSSAGG